MKIIGWNCNGAFRKKNKEILSLNPDILIVSECESPEKLKIGKLVPEPKDIKWFGKNANKGIGIFAYGNYTFELLEEYNPNFKLVIPLKVNTQNGSFLLFCIWTKENKFDKNAGYIGQVWYAINYYSNLISKNTSIIIGDFNSNKIWDKKRPNSNHSKVVDFLKSHEIESLYHMQFNEEQGKESAPTFFLHKKIGKPYHIDYCFTSKEIYKNNFNLKIGKFKNWIEISDHVPIIAELEWQPRDENISNSLLKSIKDKFSFIEKEEDSLIQIKNNLFDQVTKYEQNTQFKTEEERLKIIANTEDLLKIYRLVTQIKKR